MSSRVPSYPSTKERVNYIRLGRAVFDLCTDIYRDVLSNYMCILPQQLKNKIKSCPPLKFFAHEINYSVTNATIKNLDISLMYKLIRLFSAHDSRVMPSNKWGGNNPPPSSETKLGDDIERIRHLRNKVCSHVSDTCLADSDFQKYWSELTSLTSRMDIHLNTGGRYANDLLEIEIASLDGKWDEYILRIEEMAKTGKDLRIDLNDYKGHMNELEKKMDGNQIETSGRLIALEKEQVETNQQFATFKTETTKQLTTLEDKQKEMGIQMEQMDEKLKEESERHAIYRQSSKDAAGTDVPSNIRKQNEEITKDWRLENKVFFETRATRAVLEEIEENNILTITGNGGTGKSATIHHAALRLKDRGYEIFIVNKPDEMKSYLDPSKNQVFVADDPVGIHSMDKQSFGSWSNYSSSHRACLLNGNVKFLCSIRKEIINDPKLKQESSILNSNVIRLEDFALTEDEKVSLLENHLKINDCDKKIIDDVRKNIKEIHEAYPLICQLFCSSKDFQKIGVEFFIRPFDVMKEDLDKLRNGSETTDKTKYCTLVMCFAYENDLDPGLFDPFKAQSNDIAGSFMTACGVNKDDFVGALQRNLKSLSGVYLKQQKQGRCYQFSHDLVHDVIAFHIGQHYPEQMLTYSPSRFICERVAVKRESFKDPHVIVLEPKHFPSLLDRLIHDLDKRKYHDVMKNGCWHDEHFIRVFINDFNRNKDKRIELFCSKILHELDFTVKVKSDIEQLYQNNVANLWSWFYVAADLLHIPGITLIHWMIAYAHRRLFETIWQTLSTADRNGVNEKVRLLHYACLGGEMDICTTILCDTDCNIDTPCVYEDSVFGDGHVCEYLPLHLAAMHSVDMTNFILNEDADMNAAIQRGKRAKRTAVIWAAGFGNSDIVSLLIEKGANVNESDIIGNCLYHSAQNNHTEVVQLLLESSAIVDLQTHGGLTALMRASQFGNAEVVQLLCSYKAGIDMQDDDGDTALMIASNDGHAKVVKTLLSHRAAVNISNEDGETALILALHDGNKEVVQLLLSHNASVDKKDNDGVTALMLASQNGHTEAAKLLLAHKASVDIKDNEGRTALMTASICGHTEVVKLLVDHNADINAQGGTAKWTALMIALQCSHIDVVQLLLSEQANVDVQNSDGLTTLMFASRNNQTEVIKLLLACNARVNITNNEGWTALMIASFHGHIDVVKQLLGHTATVIVDLQEKDGLTALMLASRIGHAEIVKLLLNHNSCIDTLNDRKEDVLITPHSNHAEAMKRDNNARVDIQDDAKWTALMIASFNGHTEVVQLLLSKDADVDKKNKDGLTALMMASRNSHDKVVQLLCRYNSTVDMQDNFGYTSLMIASSFGHNEVVQLLLNQKASVDMHNQDGWTPLMMASKNGHIETVKLLLGYNASIDRQNNLGWTALMVASKEDHKEMVHLLLLSQNAGVDMQGIDGWTALMMASLNGQTEIAQLLLNYNASVGVKENKGWTALMIASLIGHSELAELMLTNNANINVQSDDKWTPLMMASLYGHTEVVQLLLSHQADVDVQSKNGWRALMMASQNGHIEVVQLLLSHSAANVNTQSDDKWTSLMMASLNGHTEVVQLLLCHQADVDVQSKNGWTALMMASQNGHIEVVQLLLSHNASVDLHDDEKRTSLMIAAHANMDGVVKLLLERNANIYKFDICNRWALPIAEKSGSISSAQLIKNQINSHLKDIMDSLEESQS